MARELAMTSMPASSGMTALAISKIASTAMCALPASHPTTRLALAPLLLRLRRLPNWISIAVIVISYYNNKGIYMYACISINYLYIYIVPVLPFGYIKGMLASLYAV